MANHKSAEKRIRSSRQKARKNKRLKSLVRDTGKKALQAASEAVKDGIKAGAKSAVQQALSAVFSKLDRAAKSGAIHRNKARRDKARLARKFHKPPKASSARSSSPAP